MRVAEARADAPTWVYRFAWPSPTRTWALHCLDVPFWFDCLDAEGVIEIAGDAPPRRLADAVHGSAVGLIRDGAPGMAGLVRGSRDHPGVRWSRHPSRM